MDLLSSREILLDPPDQVVDPLTQTSLHARGIEDLTYAEGSCARCALVERARHLCSDPSGQIPAELVPVRDAIASHPQPYSALNWVERSDSAPLLARIAAGELALSHDALDAQRGPAAEFLRQTLVAAGALPARDEALVRLEAWVARRVSQIPDPGRARLIRSYATWRVLRRARQRAARAERPRTATRHAKNHLLASIAFCDWLDHHDLTFDVADQSEIDAWIEQGGPSASDVRDFLDWTASRQLTRHLEIPNRPSRQGTSLDQQTRWAIVERLLHDDTIELTDLVAGCLVLLYGQQLTRVVALQVENITTSGRDVHLNLGQSPVIIPEPLGALLVELSTKGRRYTGVGSPHCSPWLFAGLHPGRPLNPSHLGARLRKLGVSTMPARRSALMHLAGRLPAAVLAELLNLHPTTAVHWVAAAGGDWNTYAAQIARTR